MNRFEAALNSSIPTPKNPVDAAPLMMLQNCFDVCTRMREEPRHLRSLSSRLKKRIRQFVSTGTQHDEFTVQSIFIKVKRVVEEMIFSTATGPNSVATLTYASSMVGASASWRIEGSGDAVSVGGEFDMVGGC
eukprot:scaffold157456_cov61-Attheya_sp.AAC.1